MSKPSTYSRKPINVAEVMQHDPTFGHDANNRPISRESRCECGATFTQLQLSERFLAIVERRGHRAMDLMQTQIPGFWVPVHCPPCERRALGFEARRAEFSLPDLPEAAD